MTTYRIEIERILEEGVCPFGYQVGQVFEFPVGPRTETFPSFCGWAYHEMFPVLVALKYGARLPFCRDERAARVTCSDAKNPVVFKVSLVESTVSDGGPKG
ncbi:TIGR04076 family protein [Desulfoferula mesophila]|uniref:TIGR04076 family protein n=1 Tax=Desulfoferula mesophila TaxID=3058419 RepID=A0AAU9F4E8_9BACT|nr:hypothetical protein FAK_30080 [Desulfoferula mesophilus]